MKKSKRLVILFAVVEVLLAAIMIGLVWYVKTPALPTTSPEETLLPIRRIVEIDDHRHGCAWRFPLGVRLGFAQARRMRVSIRNRRA